MVLEKINHPNDIKNLKKEELPLLADEIREFLIRTISESGGHLASNLGWWNLPWRCIWCLIFRKIR